MQSLSIAISQTLRFRGSYRPRSVITRALYNIISSIILFILSVLFVVCCKEANDVISNFIDVLCMQLAGILDNCLILNCCGFEARLSQCR